MISWRHKFNEMEESKEVQWNRNALYKGQLSMKKKSQGQDSFSAFCILNEKVQ